MLGSRTGHMYWGFGPGSLLDGHPARRSTASAGPHLAPTIPTPICPLSSPAEHCFSWPSPTLTSPPRIPSQIVTRDASPAGGSAAACAPNVRRAWQTLFDQGKTAEGRGAIGRAMSLCPESLVDSEDDVAALADWASSAWVRTWGSGLGGLGGGPGRSFGGGC